MIPLGIWDLGFYNGFREEDESREEREEKKKKGREVLKGGKKGSHHLLSTYDKWAPIGRSKCYFTLSLPYSNEINSITAGSLRSPLHPLPTPPPEHSHHLGL